MSRFSKFVKKAVKPIVQGNLKQNLTGTSPGGLMGSGARIVHRLTGTKDEKKSQARRLGGALTGAVGGFIKGGPLGALAGGALGYQSDKALTGRRLLAEGGKGFLAGAGVKGGLNMLAGKGLMGSGGGLMGLGSKIPTAGVGGVITKPVAGSRLASLASLLRPMISGQQQPQYQPQEQPMQQNPQLAAVLERLRQLRQQKYFNRGM